MQKVSVDEAVDRVYADICEILARPTISQSLGFCEGSNITILIQHRKIFGAVVKKLVDRGVAGPKDTLTAKEARLGSLWVTYRDYADNSVIGHNIVGGVLVLDGTMRANSLASYIERRIQSRLKAHLHPALYVLEDK